MVDNYRTTGVFYGGGCRNDVFDMSKCQIVNYGLDIVSNVSMYRTFRCIERFDVSNVSICRNTELFMALDTVSFFSGSFDVLKRRSTYWIWHQTFRFISNFGPSYRTRFAPQPLARRTPLCCAFARAWGRRIPRWASWRIGGRGWSYPLARWPLLLCPWYL